MKMKTIKPPARNAPPTIKASRRLIADLPGGGVAAFGGISGAAETLD
jgi:hypothetical protein